MKYLSIIPLGFLKLILKIFHKNKAPKVPKIKSRPMTNASQDRYEEYLWRKEHSEKK